MNLLSDVKDAIKATTSQLQKLKNGINAGTEKSSMYSPATVAAGNYATHAQAHQSLAKVVSNHETTSFREGTDSRLWSKSFFILKVSRAVLQLCVDFKCNEKCFNRLLALRTRCKCGMKRIRGSSRKILGTIEIGHFAH